jgi:hypothetical protein
MPNLRCNLHCELLQRNQFMVSTFSSGGSGLILCRRKWLVGIYIVNIYIIIAFDVSTYFPR